MRVTARLVSAVAAALLAVGCLIVLAELVLAAIGRDPWLVDWRSAESFGQEHSWDAAAIRSVAIVLLLVGIALLVLALRPRPPVVLDSELGTGDISLGVRRHSVEQLLDREAGRVDGVASVSSRWRGTGPGLRAVTHRYRAAEVDGEVRARAEDVLRQLGISFDYVKVDLVTRADRPTDRPAPPSNGLEGHPPAGDIEPQPQGADR